MEECAVAGFAYSFLLLSTMTMHDGGDLPTGRHEPEVASSDALHDLSAAERGGLEASVLSIDDSGSTVRLRYQLRRSADYDWRLKCIEIVRVHFFDRHGKSVGGKVTVSVEIDEVFLEARADSTVDDIEFITPPEAYYVSIRLGSSRLVTRPIPLR
jgi:hypothetical protein